jgi:hypothetical protein
VFCLFLLPSSQARALGGGRGRGRGLRTLLLVDLELGVEVQAGDDQVAGNVQGADNVEGVGVFEGNLLGHLHHSKNDDKVGTVRGDNMVSAAGAHDMVVFFSSRARSLLSLTFGG